MKSWGVFCAIVFFILFPNTHRVFGEESSDELIGGYTIEAVPSERQIEKNVSYFYLEEKPGTNDQIKVKLINNSESEKILEVKITNANTNLNGLVDYTGSLEDHKSLETPLTSIVKVQKTEVKVAPKSESEAILDIKMPTEKKEGIILGGVVVSEKQEEIENKQNVAVGNTYSYTLGILLSNESTVEIQQNKSVELEKVEAILFDGKKVVQANILNPNPYLFGEATVSGKIMNENETKVIQETQKEQIVIAPNSIYPFQFDWKRDVIKPGNYVFVGKVKTTDNEWNFKKKFKISDSDAKRINQDSVFKINIPDWLIYGAAIMALLAVIDLIYLILRKREHA